MKTGHLTPEELTAHLDGAEKLGADRLAHLRGCPQCARQVEDVRALGKLAKASRPPVPTDRMWREISRRLDEGESRRPAFWAGLFRFPRPLVTGLAGAVVAGLVAVVALRSTHEDSAKSGMGIYKVPEKKEEFSPVKAPAETRAKDSPSIGNFQSVPAGETASAPSGRTPQSVPASEPAPAGGSLALNSAPATEVKPAPERMEVSAAKKSAPRAEYAARTASVEAQAAPALADRAEEAVAAPRGFTGKYFILEAGKMEVTKDGLVKATGGVVARPVNPGADFMATVDGISRTVTGEVRGTTAEIRQPGEKLTIKTK